MLSGRVVIDLQDVEPARHRARLACIAGLPDGVRVDVVVGALRATPDACRLVAEHATRLDVDIAGQPHAVSAWLELIRQPDILTWGAA